MFSQRTITVGLIQMDCVLMDREQNLRRALQFLSELVGKAELVCLPELFTTGYNLDVMGTALYELAETIPGPTTEELCQKGRNYGMAIFANLVEKDQKVEGVLYDTSFLIDSRGELLGKYRKTHLYPKEHQFFRAGDRLSVFELDGIVVGSAICYEHAFPHIFSMLALQGARIVYIPSAVPVDYEYLLNLRTRARAQDNQMFTLAVNRVGRDGETTYCGLSKIVNPRGEVIAEASSTEEELLIAEIDLSLILKERQQEPIFRSMRPELYHFTS
ncbi:MAG: carbon-nitrogen hydrolase family protein [Candidatus Vecturithrix sp.]|nr:carbon-nitrogen hydrolase family protein [Candidatus Vecturithrix sp.]